MSATPRGFRWPDPSAAPDVSLDIHNLALDVDAQYVESTLPAQPSPGRVGRINRVTSTTPNRIYLDIGTAWVLIGHADDRSSNEDTPIGSGAMWFASAAPFGWLLCDGAFLTRTGLYAPLFAVVETTWNLPTDTDATRFRLPDLRGYVPAGVDGAAGRITGTDTLAAVMGEQNHTLTLNESPPHVHNLPQPDRTTADVANNNALTHRGTAGGPPDLPTSSAGGGAAHNNMQLTRFVNWIIKY